MEGGRKMKPAPLKISRESRMIRKPPVPLPVYQHRKPVIIHTYSPKVIQTDAGSFMWLVQRLTGSSDTRTRCEINKPVVAQTSMPGSPPSSDDHKPSRRLQQDVVRKWKSEEIEMSEDDSSELLLSDEQQQQPQRQQQQQELFGVEQLLVSPTSSSDSGLFNSGGRICAPAVASPKSPLVSFDAAGFQLGDHHHHIFATSSALATNSDSSLFNSSSSHSHSHSQQQQFPWSPIPTPNGLSHDILNDFPSLDLWTGTTPNSETPTGSRLFGPIHSPATVAFQNMAFSFIKDASSNISS